MGGLSSVRYGWHMVALSAIDTWRKGERNPPGTSTMTGGRNIQAGPYLWTNIDMSRVVHTKAL